MNELKSSANYSVFFRPLSDTHSENFLLVYQTKCQQDLMRRYGNEICLLDATYKTTRYSLPMFFVVVPTNTGYQVVGTFLVSTETSAAITEALQMPLEWNPDWKPRYWMTDCCAAEQNAVESVFTGKMGTPLYYSNVDILGRQAVTKVPVTNNTCVLKNIELLVTVSRFICICIYMLKNT